MTPLYFPLARWIELYKGKMVDLHDVVYEQEYYEFSINYFITEHGGTRHEGRFHPKPSKPVRNQHRR